MSEGQGSDVSMRKESAFQRMKNRFSGSRTNPDPSFPTTVSPAESLPSINSLEDIASELQRVSGLRDLQEALTFAPEQEEQYVHATAQKNVADLINENGIYCNRNGLSGVAQQLPEDENLRINLFVVRPFDARYTSIITLPKLPDDIRQMVRDANNALGISLYPANLLRRELPENEKSHGEMVRRYDYFIPEKFVKGYLDIQSGEFTGNERFDPVIDEEEHARIQSVIEHLTHESYHDFN